MVDKNSGLTYDEAMTVRSRKPYLVFAEMKPGVWYLIRESSDREASIRTTNFWDERVNVIFRDLEEEARMNLIKVQIEAERVSKLSIEAQMMISLNKQVQRIIEQADEANARIDNLYYSR